MSRLKTYLVTQIIHGDQTTLIESTSKKEALQIANNNGGTVVDLHIYTVSKARSAVIFETEIE